MELNARGFTVYLRDLPADQELAIDVTSPDDEDGFRMVGTVQEFREKLPNMADCKFVIARLGPQATPPPALTAKQLRQFLDGLRETLQVATVSGQGFAAPEFDGCTGIWLVTAVDELGEVRAVTAVYVEDGEVMRTAPPDQEL